MGLHRLFPLGLECAHCERWHQLADAIEHAEEFHQDCSYCKIETMMSRTLLNEAIDSIEIARRRRELAGR